MTNKYFRCFVCSHIHHGDKGPLECLVCSTKNAYCEIDSEEASNLSKDIENASPLKVKRDKSKLKKMWEEFCLDNDFMLNPDSEVVENVSNGIFFNENKYGLKLCPCRLRDSTRKRDKELVCPCHFKSPDVWKNVWKKESRCWCGLFVKRGKKTNY